MCIERGIDCEGLNLKSQLFQALEEQTQPGHMDIFVASMNLRGARATIPTSLPPKSVLKINVTTAQPTGNIDRITFSPMNIKPYQAPDGYVYACYENWWQSRKVIEGIDRNKQLQWWREAKKAHRRYPNSKGRKVLGAEHPNFPNKLLPYIESRIEIYVPEYLKLIEDNKALFVLTNRITSLRNQMSEGMDTAVAFYDFDGPRNANGEPIALKLTEDLFVEKILDPTYPFGHGYVVAALAAGFNITKLLDYVRNLLN